MVNDLICQWPIEVNNERVSKMFDGSNKVSQSVKRKLVKMGVWCGVLEQGEMMLVNFILS